MTPVITLLGRQNVGKSSLFNRLIKSRKAIIDPTPGVTRDLIYGEINSGDNIIKLIDSGGLSDEEDITNKLVQAKTREAIKQADLILFLVEAGKPMPIEAEYVDFIRKSKKQAIIVMNKSDTPDKDIYISDFYQYGFGEPIPISVAHNRNIDLLMECIEDKLKTIDKNSVSDSYDHDIKIAIIGKPNVGKSSLLNKIIDKERSIVSPIPGTTRDIVDEMFDFHGKKFLILDTAGIRKKAKVHEDIEYYSVKRALNSIEFADVIFFVIDSLENISDQDKKIADQIVKNGKGLIIALNKWDILEKQNESFKNIEEQLLFKFPIFKYVPIIPTSALNGLGIKKMLSTAIKIYEELHKRIETPDLNNLIQEIIKQYAPSSKKGVLKIYYGTQTSTAPVEFVFFINSVKLLADNYKQYIVNKIREYYGFTGIPIKVSFKDKKKNIVRET